MKNYDNVVIFDHPLIKHKITTLMTYESLKEGIPTTEIQVQTPLEKCTQTVVKDNSVEECQPEW